MSLSTLLKNNTNELHSTLDNRIMQLQPFANLSHYQGFLRMQLRIHTAAESLYQGDYYQSLLPDLELRSRLQAVAADCSDLKISAELLKQDKQKADSIEINNPYTGLGWIYTVEGSTMGAAILLKQVKKNLELSETFGARHMAPHNEGRVIHWREFKELLDNLSLTELQKQQAVQGAIAAFEYTINSVDECMSEAVLVKC